MSARRVWVLHNLFAVLTILLPLYLAMRAIDWPLKSYAQVMITVLLSLNISLAMGRRSGYSKRNLIIMNVILIVVLPTVLLLIEPEGWQELVILAGTMAAGANLYAMLVNKFCAAKTGVGES